MLIIKIHRTFDDYTLFIRAGSFKEELNGYIQQTDNPAYQEWVMGAIEKEKMKQQHLKAVIGHLESEVGTLAQETVSRMENSMVQVCTCTVLLSLIHCTCVATRSTNVLFMCFAKRELDTS